MGVTTSPEKKQQPPKRRMLAPAAYSETAMPSLRLARSSRFARKIGKILLVTLVGGCILVAIAPWQQTVKGSGNVMAYDPLDRQQVIETPIKGRIVKLGEGIFENAHVTKGQLIAEIGDIDADYLGRLESTLAAVKSQVTAAESVLTANRQGVVAAHKVVTALKANVISYGSVKEQTIAAADAAVESAKNKVAAEKQALIEMQAALTQLQANFDRQQTLYNEKIVSQLKYQESQRKLSEAKAKVAKAEQYVKAAENDLSGKMSDRKGKERKADVDIDYAKAAVEKAESDVAKADSSVAKAQTELEKARKSELETQTKVARQRSQMLVAPFDGFITRIYANQGSKVMKEGDAICMIVPDTADRAVQVWLDGNDAPLVEPGRHVRLQFEGWPAIQFAGWPSVAVGTFGGEVISVDATDDGKGKFRILILPDESETQWPRERFLRQGVRANGWVLLDQVPLWYEIWRNMNGFPPVVSTGEPKSKGMDKEKKPKLPKL